MSKQSGIPTGRASPDDDACWTRRAVVWLTLILAARLIALAFNRTDLMFDEAQYWAWAQEPAFGYYSKPPLLAWVIAGATSLCGDGEVCVRAPAPLLHWGTGLILFHAGRALYNARSGFWGSIVYATLPGVSFSSGLISTDVPLLFFWSAALLCLIRLMQTRTWPWAIALGIAIGAGLNAKYAMAYFFLCAGLYIWIAGTARRLASSRVMLPALLVPGLLIAPNLVWNAAHGFPTLSHTMANAGWSGVLFHPERMGLFFLSQFAVFGPILFAALLWITWEARRGHLKDPDRLLLTFSLPVLLLIMAQALLSRAHANWAAVAYPAATLLVTDVLLRRRQTFLTASSLTLHGSLLILLAILNWAAPTLAIPVSADPLAQARGWRQLAGEVRQRLDAHAFSGLVTNDRWVSAELLYYLRDINPPLMAWTPVARPRDHFQLDRPFRGDAQGPFLLVSLRPEVDYVTKEFSNAVRLEPAAISARPGIKRHAYFYALDGYRKSR